MADNFDRFFPDWTTGTLTITSGSKTFTATNAQLNIAPVRAGDTIITPSGLSLIIATINANGNGGTLLLNAPAAAAGTFQTCIRFQSDNSRYTGAVAALVKLATGGNLFSLAGLTGATNTMPIFTGAGTMGVTALTEFARTLLAGADANAVYTALGVIPNSQIPDRLKEAGEYSTDPNNISSNGFFRVDSNSTNTPSGSPATILSLRYSATGGYQKWFSATNTKSYERRQAGGVWSGWVDVDFDASRSSSSGYVRIPTAVGNIIVQFGTAVAVVDSGSLGTFSLPITYPSTHITALLTSGNFSAENGVIAPRTGGADLKLNSVDFRCTKASTNVRVNYLSVGY
ncbi:pyocin knob domain-containing protein [Pseudochrobactrum saccharolyticum]|uniref:pyocin knob domain-containing protein n=1 Tax=Pseudochrobactrum saccharolyticum TaxID=354352 RepID=UPI002776DE4E|nr:pyocin knob domain-containing protein [Pseudochrobactrum saccharolyticum]MDP8249632.1 hypothetical protein [Pseudochrobactrum saccharolyticum]